MALLRSTFTVSSLTMLSRITGLLRDVVLARFFGSGVEADVFFVAFRIPNLFRRVFGEGALSVSFIPVFAGLREGGDDLRTRAFVAAMIARLGLLLLVVTVVGVLAAPLLVGLVAPGFIAQPEKFALTTEALRFTFPYLFCISFIALAAGILNTGGRFAAPAFTPVLLNLCLIAAAVWLAPRVSNPALGLAMGVLIAGFVQLLFQFPFLRAERTLPGPSAIAREVARASARGNTNADVLEVFRLAIPAAFGASVNQLNILVSTLLASFLATGSVSWLYYSDRLMELPLGVFSVAIGTVLLPSLSRSFKNGAQHEFAQLMDWGARLTVLIILPAAAGLFVLSEALLTTLFQYGAFDANDVAMASRSLRAFAIGLIGFAAVKVLGPAFYARKDTRTPVRIACIAIALNIVLGVVLSRVLQHVGLAIAVSAAAWLNALLLGAALWRGAAWRPGRHWPRFLLQVAGATVAMTVLVAWGAGAAHEWSAASAAERIMRLALWITAGIGCYAIMLFIAGVRPRHFATRHLATRNSAVRPERD